MSKLMTVLGIVLLAVGAALAIVGLVSPGQVQVYGASLDTAAIFIVGGILAIGMGGVITALQDGATRNLGAVGYEEDEPPVVHIPDEEETSGAPAVEEPERAVPSFKPRPKMEAAAQTPELDPAEPPARGRFGGFGRKLAGAGSAATGAAATVSSAAAESTTSVQDTIAALEKAKSDIKAAVGGMGAATGGTAPAGKDLPFVVTEEEPISETFEAVEEDVAVELGGEQAELFVLEEREIRGRPARILSDNTVEAETKEGWMRFENLEHLNEYLDATEGN